MTRRLLALAFTILTFAVWSYQASAGVMRGDFEVSGTFGPPYHPEYSYEYRCQVEITDRVQRSDDEKNPSFENTYKLFATAQFTINNEKRFAPPLKSLNWNWVKWYYGEKEVSFKPSTPPFNFSDSSVSLYFTKGFGAQPDGLHMNVQASVRSGNYVFSERKFQSLRAGETSLEASADITGYRADNAGPGPHSLRLKVTTVCEKTK